MLKIKDDWEFNVLGIYNYRKPGPWSAYFNFVRDNHSKIPGDILESGVFRGKSLIAMGMLLKELGSEKIVYGFDSFSGFPPVYHPNDSLDMFDALYKEEKISKDHLEAVRRNIQWREFLSNHSERIDAGNISSSGDFSSTNIEFVKRKIDLIGLDNIVLVDGPFSETMVDDRPDPKLLMAVAMDCDLYKSYLWTFSFSWPRLAINGMVYLDEYYSLKFPGARIATDKFLENRPHKLVIHDKKDGDFERWYVIKSGN